MNSRLFWKGGSGSSCDRYDRSISAGLNFFMLLFENLLMVCLIYYLQPSKFVQNNIFIFVVVKYHPLPYDIEFFHNWKDSFTFSVQWNRYNDLLRNLEKSKKVMVNFIFRKIFRKFVYVLTMLYLIFTVRGWVKKSDNI